MARIYPASPSWPGGEHAGSITVVWILAIGGCGSTPRKPFAGALPPDVHVDLAGTFTFRPEGELLLALAAPCVVVPRSAMTSPSYADCGRAELDRIDVIARTPWKQHIRGTWTNASHLLFRINWKASGLDPLADDAATLVARPWTISGTQWNPTSADSQAMLRMIGAATQTETDLVRGGPAPKLEVTTFEVEGGPLRSGGVSSLVVRIANRGPGTAYRVSATLRSGIEALHGRRLSFGLIKPGADKVRAIQIAIPASETAEDTLAVLVVFEGNGAAPGDTSRRLPIAPLSAAPVLAMECSLAGKKALRPEVEAGERLTLSCRVQNTGDATAKAVDLDVSVAGGAPVRSSAHSIEAAARATIYIGAVVPRDLPIDSPVEITIIGRDRQSSVSVEQRLEAVVRKPKLCLPGQLTHAQYRTKTKALRAAVTAGDITQPQFDRYDAELVACLK